MSNDLREFILSQDFRYLSDIEKKRTLDKHDTLIRTATLDEVKEAVESIPYEAVESTPYDKIDKYEAIEEIS